MQDFDAIRPYRDEEVPLVVGRWRNDPRIIDSAARLVTPNLARMAPWQEETRRHSSGEAMLPIRSVHRPARMLSRSAA